MEETRYGLRVDLTLPYEQALERITEALQQEGFGVLTTIDVQQVLKKKLDRNFRKYVILGACNPSLADRALHAEPPIADDEAGTSIALPVVTIAQPPAIFPIPNPTDARPPAASGSTRPKYCRTASMERNRL